MAYKKPQVTPNTVLELLNATLGAPVSRLAEVDSGQIASTFSFAWGDIQCFIHFNYWNMSQGFRTETYFASELARNMVPVRKVLQQGT